MNGKSSMKPLRRLALLEDPTVFVGSLALLFQQHVPPAKCGKDFRALS
jgi:hypothetical protein